MQYPDNFDFETTRAINTPKDFKKTKGTAATNEGGFSPQVNGVRDENAVENGVTEPVAEIPVQTGITRANELDPVVLNKDFKFAVWSSVALVRFIHT